MNKKMFLLFSHTLTNEQIDDAKEFFKVEEFISLPSNLQKIWSNINPNKHNITDDLKEIKDFLKNSSKNSDIVLIQGDFGATYHMVNFAKDLELIPIYATTKREVFEYMQNNELVKKSIFKYVRFREYE